MNMTTAVRISLLKSKAHRLYGDYHNGCDNLSCGKELAEYVSTGVLHSKIEFNSTMDKLALLDPSCPKTRL